MITITASISSITETAKLNTSLFWIQNLAIFVFRVLLLAIKF